MSLEAQVQANFESTDERLLTLCLGSGQHVAERCVQVSDALFLLNRSVESTCCARFDLTEQHWERLEPIGEAAPSGRCFHSLTIVDVFTKECPAIEVAFH